MSITEDALKTIFTPCLVVKLDFDSMSPVKCICLWFQMFITNFCLRPLRQASISQDSRSYDNNMIPFISNFYILPARQLQVPVQISLRKSTQVAVYKSVQSAAARLLTRSQQRQLTSHPFYPRYIGPPSISGFSLKFLFLH